MTKLNLEPTAVGPCKMKVASGEGLQCDMAYKGVPIRVQGETITVDLYAIPLVGPDIVLGIKWLERLGHVISDYCMGTMEFEWEDGRVMLKSRADMVPCKALPAVNHDGNMVSRPRRALDYRQVKKEGRMRWEVLLEWEDLPMEEATWEHLGAMHERFPDLVLEDKDELEGDGNDASESRGLKNAYNRARQGQLKEAAQAQSPAQ